MNSLLLHNEMHDITHSIQLRLNRNIVQALKIRAVLHMSFVHDSICVGSSVIKTNYQFEGFSCHCSFPGRWFLLQHHTMVACSTGAYP